MQPFPPPSPTPTPITIATANPGKVAELRPIFAGLGIGVVGLCDLDTPTSEPKETGDTFQANATIKAVAYARQTGTPCLADDSGLVVDALDGAPGVISSHYSTGGLEDPRPRAERDAANNARLLAELQGVPEDRRSARFVCVMVLADPAGCVLATARGEMEGRIASTPRGEHGFGYDPLFLVAPDYERTSAQMSPQEKNAISHRAKAANQIASQIADNFPGSFARASADAP
ncbi:MAG: RdgB/HAM1 family non-canonical purine NTP pyrophosphatase [Phycisphaeraceae bacterium]|nr:RdgB/HAM1 family non-canonical purine NTP pyrophosphatase [Phycisphaeraceae bacterium]